MSTELSLVSAEFIRDNLSCPAKRLLALYRQDHSAMFFDELRAFLEAPPDDYYWKIHKQASSSSCKITLPNGKSVYSPDPLVMFAENSTANLMPSHFTKFASYCKEYLIAVIGPHTPAGSCEFLLSLDGFVRFYNDPEGIFGVTAIKNYLFKTVIKVLSSAVESSFLSRYSASALHDSIALARAMLDFFKDSPMEEDQKIMEPLVPSVECQCILELLRKNEVAFAIKQLPNHKDEKPSPALEDLESFLLNHAISKDELGTIILANLADMNAKSDITAHGLGKAFGLITPRCFDPSQNGPLRLRFRLQHLLWDNYRCAAWQHCIEESWHSDTVKLYLSFYKAGMRPLASQALMMFVADLEATSTSTRPNEELLKNWEDYSQSAFRVYAKMKLTELLSQGQLQRILQVLPILQEILFDTPTLPIQNIRDYVVSLSKEAFCHAFLAGNFGIAAAIDQEFSVSKDLQLKVVAKFFPEQSKESLQILLQQAPHASSLAFALGQPIGFKDPLFILKS